MPTRPFGTLLWLSAAFVSQLVAGPSGYGQGTAELPALREGPPEPASLLSQEQIASAIRELDANRFAKRRDAALRLTQAGEAAIAPLATAATSDSREVATRALAILQRHHTRKQPASLQKAATQALQRIAGENHGRVSRQARAILNPPPEPPPPAPAIQFQRGQFRIQVQNVGGRGINVQVVNGTKQITVREKNRRIKIVEDPQQGIQIELNEKQNGQPRIRKFSAKTPQELKQKHPEIHRLYVQYAQQGGLGLPQIAIGLPGGAGFGRLPRIPRQPILGELDQAVRRLKETAQRLQKIRENSQDDTLRKQLARELKSLEQTRLQLESARKKLPPR